MTDLHIGCDLSFNSTGITFYTEKLNNNNQKIADSIEFVRLIYDKTNPPYIRNLTQYNYDINLYSTDLELEHEPDFNYNNCVNYTSDQIKITTQYFICVNKIMRIIFSRIKKLNIDPKELNIYVNFEGSILSGYNFNTQIGVNMLQGYLRAELLKLQIKNQFNNFKFRIIPPTALKSFFAFDGGADKTKMIKSFIDNYNGKILLPQITEDSKLVAVLNDIVDSFALVAYNVYDMKMIDKDLLPEPAKIKVKKKRTKTITTLIKEDLKQLKLDTSPKPKDVEMDTITNILNNNILA